VVVWFEVGQGGGVWFCEDEDWAKQEAARRKATVNARVVE